MTLTQEEVVANLEDSTGWSLDDENFIKKEFTLPSFGKAVAFVNEIARLAADRDHHPQITIDHKKVTLRLYTMDVGGLTQKDFESAYAFDYTSSKYVS
ncbi:4a-hydroxytetrahydrobiopterin dehydratase [Alteribacter aurantiacus]|uniref:4a-hydroxytetrahydrobiopterin dehydratase n=1 Tax=Alteribacter aurantiacus TaxID=254410 RepID=UPI000402E20A|nr:4a-hydroxytetrahydrobiopterin dehydratase [Alteribacter aurantiacus]